MCRYEKALVVILIAVLGMIPPIGYYFSNDAPANLASIRFQPSSPIEQSAAVLTAFVIKPIYMLTSFLIAILLWKRSELLLKSLKWAMIFFFIGESFCAANYLFTENHDAHLLEYLHGLGMVLSFGFIAYALLEWIDQYALHYSEPGRKCSLSGFCRHCAKYQDVSCGLQSLLVYLGFAGTLIALMPITAQLYTISYNTQIWGTPYNYNHPIIYQLAEVRYYPALASVMFLTAVGDQMHMQVKNDLPPSPFYINKKTVAGFGNILPPGHFFTHHQHFRQDRPVGFGQIIDTSDVSFGHN